MLGRVIGRVTGRVLGEGAKEGARERGDQEARSVRGQSRVVMRRGQSTHACLAVLVGWRGVRRLPAPTYPYFLARRGSCALASPSSRR